DSLTARGLHILPTRSLDILAARGLHILTARSLDILATRGLHILPARSLDSLTARGLHILPARRLDILAARSLNILAPGTGERARSLNILALGDLLGQQVLGRLDLRRARRSRLDHHRRERDEEEEDHQGCEELSHLGLPFLLIVVLRRFVSWNRLPPPGSACSPHLLFIIHDRLNPGWCRHGH
ncbi:MAG: hypothetical protein AABZ48_02480, partial [candidate division NC10 bacterium]